MENASKALIIAGAILLSILIIAIGIYVFNQANSTITSSMTSMNTQEKEAFNNNFTTYQGENSGSNVKALLTRVSANLDTNKDEKDKVPVVILRTKEDTATTLGNIMKSLNYTQTADSTNYAKEVSRIRNRINTKHQYLVDMRIGENGIILAIAIGDITNMTNAEVENAADQLATDLDAVNEKSSPQAAGEESEGITTGGAAGGGT